MIIHLKRFQFTQHMRRKLRDFVHFPIEGLDFNRIFADKRTSEEFDSDSSKKIDENVCRSESLYDLYAVVHHQGALSGGHYVASLKSEVDGQWRLFNDAQIYNISSKDVVDSSAYILFYVRRDVKGSSLQDYWNTDTRAGEGMTEEEAEKIMKQRDRCSIS